MCSFRRWATGCRGHGRNPGTAAGSQGRGTTAAGTVEYRRQQAGRYGQRYGKLVRRVAQETRRRLCPGSSAGAAGCSGAHSVGEAAERKVVKTTSWFAGTAEQGEADTSREAGPQG